MQTLEFGRHLLFSAVCLTGVIFALALLGILLKDRRFVIGARTGFYALLVLVAGSAGCLVYGFLSGQYSNEYIYRYSESSLGGPYKFAGLWAGLDGSLLFWSLILCVYSAVAALQHRWSSRHPVGRRVEPYVYLVLAAVIFFFVLVTHQVTNPFREFDLAERLRMSPDGIVGDGHGLNPQLENYWMVIHPPSLYVGFVGFTIPFAFSMGALMAGEMGDYWIKVTRRWALFAWTILTIGIILGGLWAYEMLGWGGYWAWDPVENASILPWFVGTAFLHSVMVQERRDMLKGWNVFLIVLTFFMTIVATYMTRSGVVSSVHAFAEGTVGQWFIPFMVLIILGGAFLIGLRLPFLRGRHRLESFLSREAAFFFNNLVLLALCGLVYFLSMYEKVAHDWFMQKARIGVTTYNYVTTPFFLLLLFLTGLGPQLGWVKTSRKVLWRRILWPGGAGLLTCLVLLPQWIFKDTIPSVLETGSVVSWLFYKFHYYSTLIGMGLAVFVIGTVVSELYRSVRARVKHRGESVVTAPLQVVFGNNRRYGGYIVHVGLATMAIGIIWSSNFRTTAEMTIPLGKPTRVQDTSYTVEWTSAENLPPGTPYMGERVEFIIRRDSGPRTAEAQSNQAQSNRDGDAAIEEGVTLATLYPEMRHYPKQSNTISIPRIHRTFINDYYVHYAQHKPKSDTAPESVAFTIFVNPLVNWIWAGAVTILLGGIFAALPMPRRRIGLVD